ncbi:hypothetical protein DEM27_21890 [Metarhizobium album]|uniref:Uncharacterized protein n=1 Tax=Metarhizobium album TaxID=2182425 RepID=A0A2U2DKZ5_9HYPH|nr:hypothetical protein [Rhizobium album]PWE53987.1 hypothetical protein DEM27_21890 [Rhizobium album]
MRTNGFDSYTQLQDHLADLDDVLTPTEQESRDASRDRNYENLVRQIAWLRKEVADMRTEISAVKQDTPPADRTWSQVATTVVITFIVSEMASRLRLGLAGAVAAPIVAAKIEKQIW